MSFGRAEVLEEFVAAAHVHDGHVVSPLLAFCYDGYERARKLQVYHALHADPAWRQRRAAKMRAYRKTQRYREAEARRRWRKRNR